LSYKSECEFVRALDTPLTPINDGYATYTLRSFALEFLWALYEHLKNILHKNAFTSHVYSIMADESTDQTMEQRLIVY
jgi:hypothetical protein